jgi:hypothetical protein
MSEAYRRKQTFYADISGDYRVLATDTGTIALASGKANDTIYVQKIHIEVTTINGGGELWSFKDSAGTPLDIVPSIATSAIAHFDFDFGPNGVPCTEGKDFNLVISVATGAVGRISWEGYRKRTAVASA